MAPTDVVHHEWVPSWPSGMTGPLSDLSASPFGPELRLQKRSVQVRRGPGVRLALAVAIAVVMAPGAWLLTVQPLVGMVVMAAGAVPAVALVRAAAWQRLATSGGWMVGDEITPWDLVESFTVFRGTVDVAIVSLADGTSLSVPLRVPRRHALRERRIAEDVLARHLHQLGHALRRDPVPTFVDLGPDRDRVPFDTRCARCLPAAEPPPSP